jgi:hypothetical protein
MSTLFVILIVVIILVVIFCNSNKDPFDESIILKPKTKSQCFEDCTDNLASRCDLYGGERICTLACYSEDQSDVSDVKSKAGYLFSGLDDDQKSCVCKAVCQAKYGSDVVDKLHCYDRCSERVS